MLKFPVQFGQNPPLGSECNLTNTGTVPVNISNIATTGAFSQTRQATAPQVCRRADERRKEFHQDSRDHAQRQELRRLFPDEQLWGTTWRAGKSCTTQVTFMPQAKGKRSASLR